MSSPLPRLRVALDTDTYNEVDDQFALAHLLLSPERAYLEAVYAAPFHNSRSSGPADGMEKSYEEIQRVIRLTGPRVTPPTFRGSTSFLPDARVPVESPAARDLIDRAMSPADDPLHVVAIGAITNVASALLLEPAIASRIVLIWLGGHAPYWPDTREFNLQQDPHAARVVLDMPVPLILVPCAPVASHLITTVAELEHRLAPYSELGRYLTEIVASYQGNPPGWSKIIWDLAATACLLTPHGIGLEDTPSPVLADDLCWRIDPARRRIKTARWLDRDAIFADFFAKARAHGAPPRTAAIVAAS